MNFRKAAWHGFVRSSAILALALLSLSQGFAQVAQSDSSEPFNPIGRGLKDLAIQAQSPFEISREDAPWVIGGVGAFGALLLSDQAIYDAVNPPHFTGTSEANIAQTITKFGSSYAFGTLAGFAGYAFLANDQKAKETSYLAAEALTSTGLWTVLVKFAAARERPPTRTVGGGKWKGPFSTTLARQFSDFDSFPSGHTSVAFSLATVFAGQYSETPIVPIASYSLATLVGLSRIVVNRHWSSDVFGGALLGYLCAREVLSNNPSEVSRGQTSGGGPEISWFLSSQRGLDVLVVVRF